MHPDVDDIDHPDCIQFWTAGKTESVHDLVITDNFYTRGTGHSVQGIFLGNERSIPYIRVTITGNVFVGAGYNGIAAKLVNQLTITGNTVARYPDIVSRLRVMNSVDVVVSGNRASEFGWTNDARVPESNTRLIRSSNSIIPAVKDGGRAMEAA